MPRIELRASRKEASVLPMCYAAPRNGQLFMDDVESFIQSSLEADKLHQAIMTYFSYLHEPLELQLPEIMPEAKFPT